VYSPCTGCPNAPAAPLPSRPDCLVCVCARVRVVCVLCVCCVLVVCVCVCVRARACARVWAGEVRSNREDSSARARSHVAAQPEREISGVFLPLVSIMVHIIRG